VKEVEAIFLAKAIFETKISTQFLFLVVSTGDPDGWIRDVPGPVPYKDTGAPGMCTISGTIVGAVVGGRVVAVGRAIGLASRMVVVTIRGASMVSIVVAVMGPITFVHAVRSTVIMLSSRTVRSSG
jgi:hypothetical protein